MAGGCKTELWARMKLNAVIEKLLDIEEMLEIELKSWFTVN